MVELQVTTAHYGVPYLRRISIFISVRAINLIVFIKLILVACTLFDQVLIN